MVNAGAFVGMILTAQMRQQIQCFGDDCYFYPYMILVLTYIAAVVIFVSGP